MGFSTFNVIRDRKMGTEHEQKYYVMTLISFIACARNAMNPQLATLKPVQSLSDLTLLSSTKKRQHRLSYHVNITKISPLF